jgi:small subunit ribosomal protein S4
VARYRGPACKLCRREKIKLFLKGARCASEKCSVSRRQYPPGEHGQGRSKLSGYATQLREKQKVKRIYGILERQFRLYFKMAERAKGVTGQILLQQLERRLDNVIFRLNYAVTRKEARQIVLHNHVYVNGKKVNIPSFLVKKDDKITLKLKEKQKKGVTDTLELLKDRPVPSWLKPEPKNLAGTITELPKREDVGFPIQEHLIVELYSK